MTHTEFISTILSQQDISNKVHSSESELEDGHIQLDGYHLQVNPFPGGYIILNKDLENGNYVEVVQRSYGKRGIKSIIAAIRKHAK
jgi:hypothetical protein